MSQPIRGQGGHLVFPIGLKNTNLVEGVEILLPIKFRWIPFSGFRGEVENVSANQRPGRPFCFSDRPEKHKLGRGCWYLASCQVSLNSVQRFQKRRRKCLSRSEARAAILFFPIGPKNTNLVEGVEILLPVKFRWILFSGFREVENVKVNDLRRRTDGWTDGWMDGRTTHDHNSALEPSSQVHLKTLKWGVRRGRSVWTSVIPMSRQYHVHNFLNMVRVLQSFGRIQELRIVLQQHGWQNVFPFNRQNEE